MELDEITALYEAVPFSRATLECYAHALQELHLLFGREALACHRVLSECTVV